jgi:hypothetical protein
MPSMWSFLRNRKAKRFESALAAPGELKPGDRVRFRASSWFYQEGARGGVVIHTTLTVEQAFRRFADQAGVELKTLIQMFEKRADFRFRGVAKQVWPVIRIDEGDECRAAGMEIPMQTLHLETED